MTTPQRQRILSPPPPIETSLILRPPTPPKSIGIRLGSKCTWWPLGCTENLSTFMTSGLYWWQLMSKRRITVPAYENANTNMNWLHFTKLAVSPLIMVRFWKFEILRPPTLICLTSLWRRAWRHTRDDVTRAWRHKALTDAGWSGVILVTLALGHVTVSRILDSVGNVLWKRPLVLMGSLTYSRQQIRLAKGSM